MYTFNAEARHLTLALAVASLLAVAPRAALAEDGVTNNTIKIGMFGPLTGATSVYGYPINNGAIAIYNEINEQGGINGRKIEIVHEDGACDPAKTRAAVKKLIHPTTCSWSTAATAAPRCSRRATSSSRARCRSWSWRRPGLTSPSR